MNRHNASNTQRNLKQLKHYKYYLFCSLILSNWIPSSQGWRWAIEDRFTILPSIPVVLAVSFIFSTRRFVKRKWPSKLSNYIWSVLKIYKKIIRTEMKKKKKSYQMIHRNLPRWLVANCISMPSSESLKGQNITPALFLKIKQVFVLFSIIKGKKKKKHWRW